MGAVMNRIEIDDCYVDPKDYIEENQDKTSPPPRRVRVTFFDDEFANTLTFKDIEFWELQHLILKTTAATKSQLPFLKLATFGNETKPGKKSLRYNANVKSISGIELDYDDMEMSFQEAIDVLRNAHLTAILYTSPSHVIDKPKWRVLLPTSTDLAPSERSKMVARVNGLFGGIFAGESFTLSQAFYFGSVASNPHHRASYFAADYVDLRNDLDAGAIGKTYDDYDEPEHIAVTNDASLAEVKAAMAAIPNPDLRWRDRLPIYMSLWVATNGNEAGCAMAHAWGSKSEKQYAAWKVSWLWDHFTECPPTKITVGTLFWHAGQADPNWRNKIELIITLADWLERTLEPPDFICGKWLTTTSRIIINAETGIGKTLFGIELGMRGAAGLSFLHWAATRQINVLYVDGEMARRVMKARLQDAVARLGNVPPPVGFHMLSHEDVPHWAPLNSPAGQALIETQIQRVGRVDLIIFDNIMSLIAGDQKDEVGWQQAMPWVRSLTRRHIAQVWLHHTGHDTTRGYGTKTREWQMDNVLHFEKVERVETDVSFNLTFVKAREREPATRNDFRDVKITLTDNAWTWETQSNGGPQPITVTTTLKFYEALCLATAASGREVNGSPAATMEEWRAQCEGMGLIDAQARPDSARTLLNRHRLRLISANWIASNATLAWTLANRHAGPM
jgi:hypothetical protein